MDKIKKKKKKAVQDNQENFILKKIRYYQGSIKDYETYWNEKIAEGEKEECQETKSLAKANADLNKDYEIIPVEDDSKKEEVCPECGKNPCECEKKKKVTKKSEI